MLYKGGCSCGRWCVEVDLDTPLESVTPRECDCDYCQAHASQIISDPALKAAFKGTGCVIRQNGDLLANFYHCADCQRLLAVGCEIDGQLRGAVNSHLLREASRLGKAVQIQPRLLSADEKRARWKTLWGVLQGLP